MSPTGRPTVVVVGGGIAGLAAAWELVEGRDASPGGDPLPEVVVVDGADRLGGKLRAGEFAGRRVDFAADAFLARRPEATELCEELGIEEELVPVGASGASIFARGRLRPMPEGSTLGVPTRWWPLARSGILSAGESLRVARDLVTPHAGARSIGGDRSVGEIVEARLGRPVVERLVDPLVGGIHAGDVAELSAAATFPLLLAADQQPGSLIRRLRRVPPASRKPDPAAPVFWSLRETTASLATRLVDALERRGVTLHTGASLHSLRHNDGPADGRPAWTLELENRGSPSGSGGRNGARGVVVQEADGVVLAVGAPESARLLRPVSPAVSALLSEIEYSSVAVVTLTVPSDSVGRSLYGTGFLVPRGSMIGDHRALVTGCTYLARKWPHLARPDEELIRLSTGRSGDERHRDLDDDELAAASFGDLAAILSVRGSPGEVRVTRFDAAFPQYGVGHLIRVATIERTLAGVGSLAVAGSAFRGVGIPACIASGREAARAVAAALQQDTGGPRRDGRTGGDRTR